MKTALEPTGTPAELAQAISRALALLRAGEVVALPTETVYGLAADALSAAAVVKIFEAKERPRFDPLIVHLPTRDWLPRVATASTLTEELMDAFWPGPLTILLPKTNLVPDLVTAGLPTVALRMSAHPVFAAMVRELDHPLAAPSANRFGRISPTAAAHVLDELHDRIPLVVDGGATEHGLESTIVSVQGNRLTILREGPITREQLAEFGRVGVARKSSAQPEAPGQLPSHYAPRTPLFLVESFTTTEVPAGKRYGALAWSDAPVPATFVELRRLSTSGDLRQAATNLFRELRQLDAAGLDAICAEVPPDKGLGAAIGDRLRRAAHH